MPIKFTTTLSNEDFANPATIPSDECGEVEVEVEVTHFVAARRVATLRNGDPGFDDPGEVFFRVLIGCREVTYELNPMAEEHLSDLAYAHALNAGLESDEPFYHEG